MRLVYWAGAFFLGGFTVGVIVKLLLGSKIVRGGDGQMLKRWGCCDCGLLLHGAGGHGAGVSGGCRDDDHDYQREG